MAIRLKPRKNNVNVLKHLRKIVNDLAEVARVEEEDLNVKEVKRVKLASEIEEHRKEVDLANKVASNIRTLLGEEDTL